MKDSLIYKNTLDSLITYHKTMSSNNQDYEALKRPHTSSSSNTLIGLHKQKMLIQRKMKQQYDNNMDSFTSKNLIIAHAN